MTIHQILLKYWGYSSFREKQEDIIQAVIDGKDTLALLPTGGGKSICFQVPALVQEGLCVVVSPLIALMKDQVENLNSRGIKAIALTSGMRKREIDIALDNMVYGDYKFLYVSPERLETELFQARVKKMKVNLIAIDEAHCISQWGYDFRPSYLKIANLRTLLPGVPVLALTATATPEVVEDIQKQLEFKTNHLIQKSFERKNVAYIIQMEEDQYGRLQKILQGVKGTGIVYVNSRKRTQVIAQYLQRNGYSADYYHAGLTHLERSTKQELWMKNQTRVIVSTNAFGMGIDKPDVRFVVHLDLPETLEAYFQEAGRGGRDEKKAYAVLLAKPAMTDDLKKRVSQNYPEIPFIKNCYQALANYLQIPTGSGEGMSVNFDIIEFSHRFNFSPIDAYHALKFLEKEGYLILSEGFHSPSQIMVTLKKSDLYQFQVSNLSYDGFIRMLLRNYEGLFDGYVKINEYDIAKKLKTKSVKVIELLKKLHQLEVIDYIEQSSLPQLTLAMPRLEQAALRISNENYMKLKENAFKKMKAVIAYVESETTCRSQFLLNYFGEKNKHRCGICDVCLEQNKLELSELQVKEITSEIFKVIESEKISITDLAEKIRRYKKDDVIKIAQYLLDNDELDVNEDGKLMKL
jgi:ATP-dependent DNA helicase RecQ